MIKGKMLKNTRGKLAVGQIIVLVVGLFAFSYMLSLEVGVVRGQGEANTLGDSLPQLPISPDQLKEGTLTDKSFQTKDGKSYILEGGKWILAVKGAEVTKAPKTGLKISKVVKFFSPSTKGGFWNPQGIDTALKYSGIGSVITGVIKATLVLRSTGDKTRAAQAGARVGGSAFAGYWAGQGAVALLHISSGPAGIVVMGVTAIAVWSSKFLTRETDRNIIFECKPWQAQAKGENCDLCNDGDFPCTEYQCRSLGTGCGLINKDTDDERCLWKNENDLTAPGITADESSLEDGYRYDELSDGSGVEIKYENEECLPAFKPFELQLNLDKEGYCKMSFDRTDSFADMEIDFGGNQYKKEHTQRLTFPGADYLRQEAERNGRVIENGGDFAIYVRCSSAANDISNRDEYVFKFCTDKGPDETAPRIDGFNWIDGEYVGYFAEDEGREVGIEVYTNEPAQCKWGREDKSYEDMENNLTVCSNQPNSAQSYTCSGKLTGLLNSQENKFFFRCKDIFDNVNTNSKSLVIIGTQPLVIDEVSPNDVTIKDSTSPVKVTLEALTSAGVNRGEADCYWKKEGSNSAYILFSSTGTHTHSANIWIEPGDYSYLIQCRDSANNADTKRVSFTVETDTSSPSVVRAFRDSSQLKIITNEEGECVYSNSATIGCSYEFDQGLSMTISSDSKTHSTAWNPNKNLYIKCQDDFGNQPLPQSCNIVVRPFEV